MKTIFTVLILFSATVLPTFAELSDADLDKIRLIVTEEVTKELAKELAPIKKELDLIKVSIVQVDTRLRNVEIAIGVLTGRIDGVEKQVSHATNVTYGLIALIVVAIGILAWHGKRDRDQGRKIEELTREIETLKQRIASL